MTLSSAERSRKAKEAWARKKEADSRKATSGESPVVGEKPTIAEVDPKTAKGEVITIHFIDDGFTALEKVFYRGDQLTLEVGSLDWDKTVDREGNSWVRLTEAEQLKRYDKVFFKEGPWTGQRPMTEDEYLAELAETTDPDARHALEKKMARSAPPPGAVEPSRR